MSCFGKTTLTILFQESFNSGVLPTEWKEANICPIFKKGSRTQPCNYRPVALTSIVCKLMESIVRSKLVDHLERNKLISRHQHGFQKGKSCLTNLLETLEAWTEAIDKGNQVDCIFLDYQKAFDTVPFRRLLVKLSGYGVGDKIRRWVEAFLTGRRMRVSVNGSFSSWSPVSSGVPQGSVLGPVLFLLYVNDIPENVKCDIKIFADNTKVWKNIKDSDDCRDLQNNLDSITDWSDTWLLKLHVGKCKSMQVQKPRKEKVEFTYTMTDGATRKDLENIVEEKDLGVIISDDLKPSKQCIQATKKANSILKMVKRSFNYFDINTFKIVYKTYVRPHLEYCCQAWCPYFSKDVRMIEGVQRRATKLVREIRNLPYEVRLKKLRLYSLERRRLRGDLIETFRLMRGIENVDWDQFFSRPSLDHLRGHSLKLSKSLSACQTRQNFFSQRVVSTWNELPESVVSAENVNLFKNRLDKMWSRDGSPISK